ncbi:MAG: HAD-IA family hydrolase [Planctomycetota bacterium]
MLWDVLGTLVEDPYPRVPEWLGLEPGALLAEKDPRAWIDFELGAVDQATYAARFFRDRRSWDAEGLFARIRAAYAWRPGAEALVAELAARGVEQHALSNYPVWYQWIEARLGVARYVPWSFVSCRRGVRKPDPEAFAGALRELGVAPGDVHFVDDQPANRRAAEALGIPSYDPQDLSALARALGGL